MNKEIGASNLINGRIIGATSTVYDKAGNQLDKTEMDSKLGATVIANGLTNAYFDNMIIKEKVTTQYIFQGVTPEGYHETIVTVESLPTMQRISNLPAKEATEAQKQALEEVVNDGKAGEPADSSAGDAAAARSIKRKEA